MQADLGNITVNYEAVGTGRPFLFLHGSVADHQFWSHTLEPLFEQRTGWRRIYPDLPGHGQTHAPEWLCTEDQVLEILLKFIDHVIPGERLVVGGFSWGGYLAQGMVHRRLPDVDGVVLIAPSMHRHTNKLPDQTVLIKNPALLATLDLMLKGLAEGLLVGQTENSISRLRGLQHAIQAAALDDASFGTRMNWEFTFDVDRLPQPCDKPSLFLLGRQDHLVGFRDAWNIIDNFPRATFSVFDLAGHGIAGIEQFEACQGLLNNWLDRMEQASKA